MNSVVPAHQLFVVRFPAWIPGGALFTLPAASGGAMPMLPKNGLSGMSIPPAEVPDHALPVQRNNLGPALLKYIG